MFDLDGPSAGPRSDLFGFTPESLDEGILHYASGVLSPAIWEGYTRARFPVCVVASEMGAPAMDRALSYARRGGKILVDSGAFIWRDRPDEMPWHRVISNYRALSEAATNRLTFILPDQVGSQEGSLAALANYGAEVLDAVGDIHEVLLPIQIGEYTPAEYFQLASVFLTRQVDGLAIPSHAAAFSPQSLRLLADLSKLVPARAHFLGISRNSHGLRERLLLLNEVWSGPTVSCDACIHRAQVGAGMPITESRLRALDDYWDEELLSWDDTEESTEECYKLARSLFPDLDDDALSAVMTSQMGAYFDTRNLYQRHMFSNGPRATSDSIYAFAMNEARNSSP